MPTPRGLDRLVAFADAVVAIALTLLVLPLVDLPSQPHHDLPDLFSDHFGQIAAFVLSFVVIARLWRAHHRMFETVIGYDTILVRLTLAWLFTVVVLPFPTQLVAIRHGSGVSAFYIGTLLASSLALSLTRIWLTKHPALRESGVDDPLGVLGVIFPALLALALLATLVIPGLGLWPLLLLLLTNPIERLVTRVRARSHA